MRIVNTNQPVNGPRFRNNHDKIFSKKPKIKLIIAGGRHYLFTDEDEQRLSLLSEDLTILEVVSGGAAGADQEGEEWAHKRGIPVKHFFPDWNTHGKAAGPIRNREMAEYADAVALFPGGRGTKSMYNEAVKAGIKIYDYRDNGGN